MDPKTDMNVRHNSLMAACERTQNRETVLFYKRSPKTASITRRLRRHLFISVSSLQASILKHYVLFFNIKVIFTEKNSKQRQLTR